MFWERFFELCRRVGKSPNSVARELGISSGAITSWKRGVVPHHGTLIKIAEYFGVTVDHLLGSSEAAGAFGERLHFLEQNKIYMIPLFERVSAGAGSYADEQPIGAVPCYIESGNEAAETICIRVQGDSMFPKIEEGDTIQVHMQSSVDSGSIAVLLVDGDEAVVKRLIIGDGYLELHSFNPMYPVRRFEGEQMQRVRVLGAVRKIIKEV